MTIKVSFQNNNSVELISFLANEVLPFAGCLGLYHPFHIVHYDMPTEHSTEWHWKMKPDIYLRSDRGNGMPSFSNESEVFVHYIAKSVTLCNMDENAEHEPFLWQAHAEFDNTTSLMLFKLKCTNPLKIR